jgi:hypothetical protein
MKMKQFCFSQSTVRIKAAKNMKKRCRGCEGSTVVTQKMMAKLVEQIDPSAFRS